MSSPCTRLVRCRAKNLTSCFYACHLPSEEDEPTNGKMIFDSEVENLSCNNIISQGGRVWGDGNGSEPRFAEEDYIVFCFREDGEIDTISQGNYNKSSGQHADIISATTNRKKVDEKSKEKGTNDEINNTNSDEQRNNASKMTSLESFDSNLSSDTSTSSFAFPKLGLDWIGSPVHMPKSEKAEARNRLHCCSF